MSVRRWLSLIVVVTVLGRVSFIVLFDHTLSLQTSGYDTYAVNVIEGAAILFRRSQRRLRPAAAVPFSWWACTKSSGAIDPGGASRSG
jgi:hypothetical protein